MKTVESSWLSAPHITTRQIYCVVERALGMCKSMRKKALDENKCLYSGMWMYRTTPLSHNMPSTYSSLEYWYQVATMLYSQLMQTTSTTETWTNYTRRNKPSTTTELALAGQFKQLSHEPEKFRWLNGIRTHQLRALHQHRRGHGFESRWVTWIFQVHETIA